MRDSERSQRLLQDSLHEGASTAVASLLQRKLVPVAIREASRLGRNREAWDKKGTSPFGLGVSGTRPKNGVDKSQNKFFGSDQVFSPLRAGMPWGPKRLEIP